jgi:hypothetical protein
MYQTRLKLHQFLALLVALCFTAQFMTAYLQRMFSSTTDVYQHGKMTKVFSEETQTLFKALTGKPLVEM